MKNLTEQNASLARAVWPLVSCIMPTFNRRAFIPLALQGFFSQDYPHRELLILDDGNDPIGDLVEDLPGVRYIRLPNRMAIGAKRNLACEQARGDIIAQWDDDDWYSPGRLTYQVAPLLTGQAEITGLENQYVMTLPSGDFWTVNPRLHERMFVGDVHGGTLVFRRVLFADGSRYPEVDLAEDAAWLRAAMTRGARLARLPNRGVFVYSRHGRNAWQFETGQYLDPNGWRRVEPPGTFPREVIECYQEAMHGAASLAATSTAEARAGGARVTWLDALAQEGAEGARGTLGLHGQLGVDGRIVRVQRHAHLHAIGMAAPACATFPLEGRYTRFACSVAINDTTPANFRGAHFAVFGDRKLLEVAHVEEGADPARLEVNVTGVGKLDLHVLSTAPQGCQAVWIDPFVDCEPLTSRKASITDALEVATIQQPASRPRANWCIATVVTPATAQRLDVMLASLLTHGACPEALLAIFALDADQACARVAAKYGALLIPCYSRGSCIEAARSILLSAPQVIDADSFLCIDPGLLVLEEVRGIFTALNALPADALLSRRARDACPGAFGMFASRREVLVRMYAAVRRAGSEKRRPARKPARGRGAAAADAIKAGILRSNFSAHPRRVELDEKFGVSQETKPGFVAVADPLIASGERDFYALFLASLRTWVGRYGMTSLIWSFYGAPDGSSGRIRDRTTMPLFAAIHALVRANGCVRVLETGTARGVSAACLASAVAGRAGAQVVTFDPHSYEGREELWALLSPEVSACIELRTADSLDGMAAALAAGERFDAVFLDSEHHFDHVWNEFLLATKLVCSGGLILIHDARFKGGDVPRVLERIEQSGYGVVRLWSAATGVCEDGEIGMAVIENRCRVVR